MITAEIMVKVERLGAHALSGRVVPEFTVEHLRKTIYLPCRIVYRYDKNKVHIVRVWRGERTLRMP